MKLTVKQQQLVTDHMGYVRALVYRQWQQSDKETQADLIQVGYLALMDAAILYDPSRHNDTPFLGYARFRVRKYISEYVNADYTIRPPWRIIKSTEQPDVVANQPLVGDEDLMSNDVLDRYGADEAGYEEVEDADYYQYLTTVMASYPTDIRTLYLMWMAGTIDWGGVDDDTQELLFELDSRVHG